MLPARPLGSTGITRHLRYYGPLRLPLRTASRLCLPCGVLPLGGSPRFLGCSVDARCPLSPRRARRLHILISSPPVLASPSSAGWPLSSLVSRGRTGFACATAYVFVARGFAGSDYSALRPVDYMSTRNLHDQLLSVGENSQACPGAPKNTKIFEIRRKFPYEIYDILCN